MQNTETAKFRAALNYFVKKKKRGMQAELSRATGINLVYLNEIVNGRKPGSEEVRAKIADFFGLTYEKFLELGDWLLKGKDPDEWFVRKALQDDNGIRIPPKIKKIMSLLMEMDENDIDSMYRYAEDKAKLRMLEKKVQKKKKKNKQRC